jgi:hypothetical protein
MVIRNFLKVVADFQGLRHAVDAMDTCVLLMGKHIIS